MPKKSCPQNIFIEWVLPAVLILSLTSCGSITRNIQDSEIYSKNHTGFHLYNPETGKVLAAFNDHKYYTPASNTKIFTLFAGLNILGDSIPGLYYSTAPDSLIVWGTGDPSYLNPNLPESQIYDFLKSSNKNIYLSLSNFDDDAFGPGWAWDDYPYAFQPEKAPFPIYGNIVHVENREDTAGLQIQPSYFDKFITPDMDLDPGQIRRGGSDNLLYSGPQPDSISFERNYPFKYSSLLLKELMEDTLNSEVSIIDRSIDKEKNVLFSIKSDSLYKVMMKVSDNFIAEQIMLICAGVLSDTLQTQIAIDYTMDSLLSDLPDRPVWRDGSGLSRYNLFTPRSIVKLWEKIYAIVPEERLFSLLASGGDSGTIKDWYSSEEPYIFGKTGTLSNNHTLSGFIKTKKGNTLIFSFMHNNYTSSSSEVKREMEKTLWEIHEKY